MAEKLRVLEMRISDRRSWVAVKSDGSDTFTPSVVHLHRGEHIYPGRSSDSDGGQIARISRFGLARVEDRSFDRSQPYIFARKVS